MRSQTPPPLAPHASPAGTTATVDVDAASRIELGSGAKKTESKRTRA
eukprot:CAMPEP_0119078706 /NCGR_PEP_ID=MMETSP1178-20130426/102442_1 /TAXON_ID=33656 /ORGANISM="unid sp, Strain CCMP2000" /LENGTH=46 /DNA_ID= /DNA_START= /DNA_END= /DNA_ORIENTATION=